MAEYLINLRNVTTASAPPFVDLTRDGTTPVALGDGWTINYISGFVAEFDTGTAGVVTTSGDAAWANQDNVVTSGHRPPAGGAKLLISGDPGASIVVDIYSNGFPGRIVEWNLNGGAFVAQECDTLTQTITLTGSLDGSGEATLIYQEAAGSSPSGPYSNAVRITSAATVSVPGISALTVQKDGSAVQASDWEINVTLVSGGTEVYSGSAISSDASGIIAAIDTTGGSVGDPVRVEGYSDSNNYGFVFTQNLEDNA